MNTTRIKTEIEGARQIFGSDAAMTLRSGLLSDTFPSDAYARIDRIITDIREAGLEQSAESIAEATSLHMRECESVRAMIGLEMAGEDIPLRQRMEKIDIYVSAGKVLADRLGSTLERLEEQTSGSNETGTITGTWSRWIDGKDGIAKAMTGNPEARWRDVSSMFEASQIDDSLPGRKICVRIDHLNQREADRLK